MTAANFTGGFNAVHYGHLHIHKYCAVCVRGGIFQLFSGNYSVFSPVYCKSETLHKLDGYLGIKGIVLRKKNTFSFKLLSVSFGMLGSKHLAALFG